MNRRSFLAALAAPLLIAPTLEEIERLTWRRFFPGWSPASRLHCAGLDVGVGDTITIAGFYRVNGEPEQFFITGVTSSSEFELVGLDGRGPNYGLIEAGLLRRVGRKVGA